MREIEIKLRVKNLDELEKRLTESGLVISKEVAQHDVVYAHKDDTRNYEDAYEGHIAVRIRNEGDSAKLTVKQQLSNQMDNIEHEMKVENGETMHQMLLLLGWKPEVEVKKIRKKGKLGEYEVCLDKVEQLGDFMELEKMTDDNADPDEIRKKLFEVLRPFGLTEKDEETNGYDVLIYQLKNK